MRSNTSAAALLVTAATGLALAGGRAQAFIGVVPHPPASPVARRRRTRTRMISCVGVGDSARPQSSFTAPWHPRAHLTHRTSGNARGRDLICAAKKDDSEEEEEEDIERYRRSVQLKTLVRVGVPAVLAGVASTLLFPALALGLATAMNDAGVFAVLSQDSSQFVQNFLTVAGLLFSILVGQTYYFMYQQQEAVYYALFNEVTEAKSLLEQVALVCQGRAMYKNCLTSIAKYVREDLKQLQSDPAVLLSARPVDDPLESIMYMTSVGVPSSVYETVRSLRQARAARLGALQRKLPVVHMVLLWILAAIELCSFPLLGAGTQTIGGYNILTVEGCLFGVMTFGIVMTLRVVGELWRPAGGAYNVDGVLSVMVRGLDEELKARMAGSKMLVANRSPSLQYDLPPSSTSSAPPDSLPMLSQGVGIPDLIRPAKWAVKKFRQHRDHRRKS